MSAQLNSILERHHREGIQLLEILRETQDLLGWLSPETLSTIAIAIGWPRARVESTASFYSFFHTSPPGRYRVLFSDNITDRMLGSRALMLALCKKLWLEPGRTSEDGLLSVDTTSCTGLCDQGPAALVNYRALPNLTPERINAMAELIRGEIPVTKWPAEWFHIEDNIRRRDVLLNHNLAPGEALTAGLARGATGMLDEVNRSGLRGRGGAGFFTGLKWQSCRDAPGDEHYVVCNADEGEPGTFKDRILLTSHADLVFEGMTLAGFAISARKGLLYLRGEYRYLLEPLKAVLMRRREAGLLGTNILGNGFAFDIEIRLGAGAYICGEESALIESLEGRPGKPRIRPPYPVTQGYLKQPTTVNNVETLAAACLIAKHGGAWFATIGTAKSAGTKLLSVSGDVARPGIYEYPFGISIAEVLVDAGATDVLAVQISGAAGNCLADNEFERRIAYEDVPTAGSFMVFNHHRDMFDVASNFVHFFAHESCGFCTPCRVGTAVNRRLIDKIAAGHGSPYDIKEMLNMHLLMQGASHCGLGNSSTMALTDILNKFRPAFERRLLFLDYKPGFDLDYALSEARRTTGRDDADAHFGRHDA
ncbi:MAG: NAD(P)H-dependent oxidoreductase subunit E [Georgfuchsia sp.]